MIAQSSDCVMVVMAESECLLGVRTALLHSCPVSTLSGPIQSVAVFTCTSEPAWKTTLWVFSVDRVESQQVMPCLAVLRCTHWEAPQECSLTLFFRSCDCPAVHVFPARMQRQE